MSQISVVVKSPIDATQASPIKVKPYFELSLFNPDKIERYEDEYSVIPKEHEGVIIHYFGETPAKKLIEEGSEWDFIRVTCPFINGTDCMRLLYGRDVDGVFEVRDHLHVGGCITPNQFQENVVDMHLPVVFSEDGEYIKFILGDKDSEMPFSQFFWEVTLIKR